MNTYAWPASVTKIKDEVVRTFPDWPDVSASGTNIHEAMLRATDALSMAVLTRIGAGAVVPQQSDLGPRQIQVAISADAAARLDGYLEDRQLRGYQHANEMLQAYYQRRAAFLTEYHASIDPVERVIERLDSSAREFATVGIRFSYILNAGGLVVIPAIMELLPTTEVDREELLWPAGSFAIGVILAALTNYSAYLSVTKASEAWSHESNAREKVCSGSYYTPDDQATHQSDIVVEREDHDRKLWWARCYANIGIGTFGGAILAFFAGVGLAIFGLW